jgi:hypothetical protein
VADQKPKLVTDLLDEWKGLANSRYAWESYWRQVAKYVLPNTATYDMMLGSTAAAVDGVINTPAASRRTDLYDMTSLWAIERLTAGILSLKTPESQPWQDLGTDSLFGEENTHGEKVALEKLRDYMFKVRGNPRTGFWPAHKSAIRSMCAFGDGFLFVEETTSRDARIPYRYTYLPITEVYPGVNSAGIMDRMFRVFRWSAVQLVGKFGYDNVPRDVQVAYDVPQDKHKTFRVMHAVRPRPEEEKRGRIGVMAGDYQSIYLMPDDECLLGEGGFNEFPFVRYAWNNSGLSPFCEGPVAYAIGELRSLQEMARNELIATQQMIRPAYATYGKNFQRLNLNPGAVNPGLINGEGKQLFAPMNSGTRPDFAQGIMEARRNSLRELLYLNLWQIIIQDKNDTATQALIKAQEKGELLGPVGISMNEGLSMMTDREIAILGRKGAFDAGSPLEMPDSLGDREVSPIFTSPLDRLRRMSELIGMQRLVEFATMLAGGDPQKAGEIMARFDIDEMLERAQEILGAPAASLKARETANADRDASAGMQQGLMALEALKQGGEAATAIGNGATALGQGADVAQASRALPGMMEQLPAAAAGSMAGAM